MKPETKTSLGAIAVLLCSLAYIYLISFNNQMTEPAAAAVTVFVAAVVVAAVVVAAVVAVVIVVVCYDRGKKKFLLAQAFLLLLVFIIPLAGIFPLSKYHNLKCLERDEKIANKLIITSTGSSIEIILPLEYSSENSYMEEVLSIRTEPNEPNSLKLWKELAVYCKEGEKEWYKATLPGDKKESLVLFFNHAWEDKTIVLPIP